MKDYSVAKVTIIVTNIYAITHSSKTLQEAQKKEKSPYSNPQKDMWQTWFPNEKEISSLR